MTSYKYLDSEFARPSYPGSQAQLLQTTKFTCCARCGAVAPRVLGPTRQKIADKAQAGRLFCALPRGAPGTFGDTRRLS